jgi:tRNA (mo5U34)-methyltransferase
MDRMREVQQMVSTLTPWFHNLHLPDGTQTAPHHPLGDFPLFKWKRLSPFLPQDLAGARALDIGCNAGFYSIELARRGAKVLGIDVNSHYLTQARWASTQFGVEDRIELRQMQVYDLAHCEETFDIVLFMGVFYHLRYPMLGLDIVTQKVRSLMIFQTLTMPGEEIFTDTYDQEMDDREAMLKPGWPKMAFIEHRFAGDPTNWWAPNHAGVEAMLRSSGMRVIGRPGHEIYLCEPDKSNPSCVTTWNVAEYASAIGKSPHMVKSSSCSAGEQY